jgi:hypothetical protein
MNDNLRNRYKSKVSGHEKKKLPHKAHPEKSLEAKIASFFEDDPKLNKYAVESNDYDEIKDKLSAVLLKIKEIIVAAKKSISKNVSKVSLNTYATVLGASYFKRSNRLRAALPVLVLVVVFGFLFLVRVNKDKPQVQGAAGSANAGKVDIEPSFSVLKPPIPKEQNIDIVFDEDKKVASFAVKIGDALATISQQELSVEEVKRENFLLTVAQSFGINKEVSTMKGPLFLGSNEKEQVSTAVFLVDTYLIFIRTQGLVTDTDIITFVNNLQG